MKRTFIKKGILACIATLLTVASSFAQTITTGAVSPAAVCSGNKISAAFTKTGTFPTGTEFTLQLSDAAGAFTSPVEIGTGTTSPIEGTVTAAAGTGYKVRVISVTPAVTGAASAAFKVNAIPAAPTVSNINYKVGDDADPLTAGGTGLLWYTAATGGSGKATAPTPSTATAGTTSYYVSQTIDCESPRAKIDIIVAACTPPAAPTVTPTVNYTIGDKAVPLEATGVKDAVFKWYSSASSTTPLTGAPTPPTITAVTISYFVTQTVGGCESAKAEIVVNIAACTPPAPPKVSNAAYCLGETAATLTATGTALKWYAAATGGTGSTTAPKPTTTAAGTTNYYVTQTVGCESSRAKIEVVVKAIAPKPTVSAATINLCQNSTATALTATGVTGATFSWYKVATDGDALSSAPVPNTAAAGPTSYYVSQSTANLCEGPRTKVDVVIKDSPAAPAVTPVTYCVGQTTVTLTPSGGVYKWYSVATGGTGSVTAPKPSSATDGTVSYYVTQSNTYGSLSCESPRAKLDVVVNPLPATLAVTSDVLCQERDDKTYTFPAKPTNGNTINWYTAASGGTASKNTPTVNLKTPGETTFYATQITSKGCESASPRSVQKVRVKVLPGVPGIDKPLIEYCQFIPAAPLTATPVTSGILNWYGTNSTGGSASPSAPTPSTSDGGTISYYVGQTLEGCVGDRTKIDVKINTTPVPQTTAYLAYCQGVTAPRLEATGSVLKWYRASTDTEFQGFPYTPFTEKVQDYSFYVTQTGDNGCESPKEEIKIHIKALPSATISGNTTIALGETANITLKFTSDGPWKYILSNGVTDSTSEATKTVPVTPKTTTTYLVTGVSNACGKGTPIGSALVTVKIPTINSGNPSVSEACASKTFGVPFQQSGDFPDGNKFNVQISLVNEDSKFYTIPSVATSNLVTATFPDTTRSGNYFVRVISSGTNPDLLVKGSVSAVGISANPLPLATITGTQTILIGDSGDLKVEFTGKGPWSFGLYNGTQDSTITANSTPYSFKISPRVTTTYTISSVINGCGKGRSTGSARVQVDPILGVEPPVTDWVKVYPTIIAEQCKVEVDGTISPKEASVQIIDMNGRSLSEKVIRQKITEVDFSRYPSGLYLLRVQNGNLNSVHRVMKP